MDASTESADGLLIAFANAAQSGALEMTVTLVVSGVQITGTMTNRDRWLRELRALAGDSENAGALIDVIEDAYLGRELEAAALGSPATDETCLHLVGATVLDGNDVPLRPWRCAINRVGAWSLGSVIDAI